jgi:hypothetical protein
VEAIVANFSTSFMMLVIKTIWQLPRWLLEPSRGACDGNKITTVIGYRQATTTRGPTLATFFHFFIFF